MQAGRPLLKPVGFHLQSPQDYKVASIWVQLMQDQSYNH